MGFPNSFGRVTYMAIPVKVYSKNSAEKTSSISVSSNIHDCGTTIRVCYKDKRMIKLGQ